MRAGRRASWVCGIAALAARLFAGQAHAQDDFFSDWLQQPYITGDWGGVRTKLEKEGISLRAHYISETAGNPTGGLQQATQYAQQIDFGADIDLEKLAKLRGGQIHVTFSDRAGNSLSSLDLGALAQVQEIFGGGQDFRLAILTYEQSLFDDKLDIKGGWLNAGDDFATSPLYCYLQNNAFCGNPVSITLDAGFSTFPSASWGGIVKLRLESDIYAQAGAYQVNPSNGNTGNGFKFGSEGVTGIIVPLEVGWTPDKAMFGLPGDLRIGGYYDNSTVPDLGAPVNGPQQLMSGRWGLYLLADQMIWREGGPSSSRGFNLFAGFTYADPSTALIQYFWEAGLVKKGTFPGRDNDSIAFAVSQALVSNSLVNAQNQANITNPGSVGVQSYEMDLELNYRAQIAPWFTLMPNLQYVVRPGGVTSTPNAFVLGLQAAVTF
ncbi:MAG TPA: carbohydrate porin [Dongiaceae bacterium]|nr:carbohydrate porin [Dongiaceae bacterium]